MRRNFLLLSLMLMLAGCATAPPAVAFKRPAAFPSQGTIDQRVVLSLLGRQFVLNAYLALNQAGGTRLTMLSDPFGTEMADVLIKTNGDVTIFKSSRLFPEKYIRKLMVPDVESIFGSSTNPVPVTVLAPDHYLIDHGTCKVSVRIVKIKPGPPAPAPFQ